MSTPVDSRAKSALTRTLATLERALTNAQDSSGKVDLSRLRASLRTSEAKASTVAILERSLDLLEERFARSRSTSTGCGRAVLRTNAKSLTAREVRTVFQALIEAKSKGLVALDTDGDGRITTEEVRRALGGSLSEALASVAVAPSAEGVGAPGVDSRVHGGGARGGRIGC